MLSKEDFINTIKILKESTNEKNKINELFGGHYCNELIYSVIWLIEKTLDISNEYQTIEWWCNETNFGDYKNDLYIDINKNTKINVGTVEKLYDYLLKYESEHESDE